jgi:elongation factor Ts
MFDINDVRTLRDKTGAGVLDCKKALEATNGDMDAAVDYLREKGISKAAKKESRIAAEGTSEIFIDGNNAVILEVNSETDFVAKNEEFKKFVTAVGEALLKAKVTTMEEALEVKAGKETIKELNVNLVAKLGEKISFRRFEFVTKEDNEVFGAYTHMGGKISTLTVLEGANEEVARDVSMHVTAQRPLYITRDEVPEEVINHEKEIIKEQAINEGKPADIAEKMVNGRIQKYFKENCLIHQAVVKDGDIDVETYVKNNGGSVLSMIRYEVGEGMEHRSDNFAEEVAKQVAGN